MTTYFLRTGGLNQQAVQIVGSHDVEGIAAGDRLMLSSAGDPNICGQLSTPSACGLYGMGCEGFAQAPMFQFVERGPQADAR